MIDTAVQLHTLRVYITSPITYVSCAVVTDFMLEGFRGIVIEKSWRYYLLLILVEMSQAWHIGRPTTRRGGESDVLAGCACAVHSAACQHCIFAGSLQLPTHSQIVRWRSPQLPRDHLQQVTPLPTTCLYLVLSLLLTCSSTMGWSPGNLSPLA